MKNNGFTLIELLVVVLIIGILAAVAVPQYQTALDKAKYASLMAAVRAVKDAQELFYMANGRYTKDLNELAAPLPGGLVILGDGQSAADENIEISIYSGGFVYGVNKKGVGSAYLMYYDKANGGRVGVIHCYAYASHGERGKKLCKSLGGTPAVGYGNCGGDCTIFELP